MLRRVLYEAANVILTRVKRPFALQRWGRKLAEGKGSERPKVAVARKLAALLHTVWLTETEFRSASVSVARTVSAARTGLPVIGRNTTVLYQLCSTSRETHHVPYHCSRGTLDLSRRTQQCAGSRPECSNRPQPCRDRGVVGSAQGIGLPDAGQWDASW